jgi:hypothetical protein
MNADERVASKPFKACVGHPVLCVGEVNGGSRGAGAQGTCIVCDKKMNNWLVLHCVQQLGWCCNYKSIRPMLVLSTSGISIPTLVRMEPVIISLES